ncbi:hypothetical protein [Mesorhizobium sp. Z1-4]|uniref:hypothetical protein n=1 Tax=Mesorhizobium sp. Z1-4 TaxID=2448478 RepID=UPI000FD7DE60|nr:hypothetical protein [Mesorhizobium sp. Z1-4]
MQQNRSTLIAAAIIMAVFALLAFYLPDIMMAAAEFSPVAAGAVVVLFLLGFFVLFWLRGRHQNRKR